MASSETLQPSGTAVALCVRSKRSTSISGPCCSLQRRRMSSARRVYPLDTASAAVAGALSSVAQVICKLGILVGKLAQHRRRPVRRADPSALRVGKEDGNRLVTQGLVP